MLIFARYIMFSEVIGIMQCAPATAMVQRAFYLLHGGLDLDSIFRLTDHTMIDELRRIAGDSAAVELLDGLFGPTRKLYKRLTQLAFPGTATLRRTRPPAVRLARAMREHFAAIASTALGRRIAPHEILFDAPPMKREVEFQVDIFFRKSGATVPCRKFRRSFASLTTGQFDDYVKRVRILCIPAWPPTCARFRISRN